MGITVQSILPITVKSAARTLSNAAFFKCITLIKSLNWNVILKSLAPIFILISGNSIAQSSTETIKAPAKIGILLPFQSQFQKPSELTDLMLDYAAGFNMALDDLKAEGFPIMAMVDYFDSDPSDSIPINQKLIKNTLSTLSQKKFDLIIGPIYEQNFKTFSATNIPTPLLHISPLKYIESKGLGSKFNFFLNDSLKLKALAHTVNNTFNRHSIFIVTDGKPTNSAKAESIKMLIDQQRGNKHCKIIGAKNGVFSLNKKDSCVIIVCSEDTKFRGIASSAISSHSYSWIVGDLSWFEDKRFYQNQNQSNCLYPTVNYVEISDSIAVDFSRRYFQREMTEPSRFSYIGYDQARFLMSNYMYSNWETWIESASSSANKFMYYGLINNISTQGFTTKKNQPEDVKILNLGLRLVVIDNDVSYLFKP